MSKEPILREIPSLPDEIIEAGLNGNLIFFVGSGFSIMLGLPSWKIMAQQALSELNMAGFIDYSELEQLKNLDPKKQLSIARLIADDNKFDLDLSKKFTEKSEDESIYKTLNDIGCTCVTTNYDLLLAPRFKDQTEVPGSFTPKKCTRIYNKADILPKYLTEPGNVIHLHGSIKEASSMIVTTREYLQHYDNEYVQVFLKELFDKHVVLFLGYGLEEAEILEHILRRGSAYKNPERRRFVLQGYFKSQEPLYKYMHLYYDKSFGVNLIGFIRDHSDYQQQEEIIKSWAPKIKVNKSELTVDLDFMNEVLDQ
ncbi:MAG: SIR2 family protein [Methylococcales bacterium]